MHKRRSENIKAAGSDEEEEQLALEYKEEAEDISRLRGRTRRRSREYLEERSDFGVAVPGSGTEAQK